MGHKCSFDSKVSRSIWNRIVNKLFSTKCGLSMSSGRDLVLEVFFKSFANFCTVKRDQSGRLYSLIAFVITNHNSRISMSQLFHSSIVKLWTTCKSHGDCSTVTVPNDIAFIHPAPHPGIHKKRVLEFSGNYLFWTRALSTLSFTDFQSFQMALEQHFPFQPASVWFTLWEALRVLWLPNCVAPFLPACGHKCAPFNKHY